MGRPTLLTPETQDAIVTAVSLGNSMDTAADVAGLDRATVFNWMAWGRDGKQPYVDFFDAVTRARAQARMLAMATVRSAFADPKIGAENARWYLERVEPKQFGRRDHVVVESKVREELDGALVKLEQQLDPETFARVLSALSDGAGGSGEAGADSSARSVGAEAQDPVGRSEG